MELAARNNACAEPGADNQSNKILTRFAPAKMNVYCNPIMGGDHPDASPIRVGGEFYLTHSSFDYAPGLLIWHSLDLINWRPVAAALRRYFGSIWAPYLCEYRSEEHTSELQSLRHL